MQNTYADEIAAFLLIALGLLTLLVLLSPDSGQIGNAWADFLTRSFGFGAYLVPLAIMALGAVLLLPKLGVIFRFNWWRIIAGELLFVFALAYLHATVRHAAGPDLGTVEAFAVALEGQGGGLVGWAIQDLIFFIVGDWITGAVLLSLLVFTGLVTLGLRRSHLIQAMEGLRTWLLAYAGAGSADVLELGGDGLHEVEVQPIEFDPFEEEEENPPSALREYRTLKEELMDTAAVEMRFILDEVREKRRVRKRSPKLPPWELLDALEYDRPSDLELNVNAHLIERTVGDFGMNVQVIGVKAGPTVTQYAVQPFSKTDKDGNKVVQRVRVTRVTALASDLTLALQARRVRIQAPVPGTNYIGVEVPNPRPGIVSLRPVMESDQFARFKSPLAIALGREVDGRPIATDLAKMPHLLIGGTTGSGKSVCLRAIATCLIANNTPQQLRLIMIDPKMVELIRFNGLPHLLGHVEVQPERAIGVLRWVTREMERRYKLMEEAQARNIATYNQNIRPKDRLPYMVVLVDELAELMGDFRDETEHLLTRLAQMARATGIHLVVATQRPSTDVLTGLIKANFPARIAFAVASGTDSRVIIDSMGADELIGRGDMLFQSPDAMAPVRAQGCFVSDREMESLVDFWRDQGTIESEEAPWERILNRSALVEATDPMLLEAARIVQTDRIASASLIQRKLNIGYPRAGRIIDSLFRLGIVGPEQSGGRLREVLIPEGVDPVDFIMEKMQSKR